MALAAARPTLALLVSHVVHLKRAGTVVSRVSALRSVVNSLEHRFRPFLQSDLCVVFSNGMHHDLDGTSTAVAQLAFSSFDHTASVASTSEHCWYAITQLLSSQNLMDAPASHELGSCIYNLCTDLQMKYTKLAQALHLLIHRIE